MVRLFRVEKRCSYAIPFFQIIPYEDQIFARWHFDEVPAAASSSGAELGELDFFTRHHFDGVAGGIQIDVNRAFCVSFGCAAARIRARHIADDADEHLAPFLQLVVAASPQSGTGRAKMESIDHIFICDLLFPARDLLYRQVFWKDFLELLELIFGETGDGGQ